MRLPMSRIAGRSRKASGQITTAGWEPVVGWMKAASQVPSGVFTSTLVSTTGNSAADTEPVAAARPAASDIATKSRRDRSLCDPLFSSWSRFSSVMVSLLSDMSHSPALSVTSAAVVERRRLDAERPEVHVALASVMNLVVDHVENQVVQRVLVLTERRERLMEP